MSKTEPNYYNNKNGKDLFDEFEEGAMPREQTIGFYFGNIRKYIRRYPFKNGAEDVQKAQVYLDRVAKFTEMRDEDYQSMAAMLINLYHTVKKETRTYNRFLNKLDDYSSKSAFHNDCMGDIINEAPKKGMTVREVNTLNAVENAMRQVMDIMPIKNAATEFISKMQSIRDTYMVKQFMPILIKADHDPDYQLSDDLAGLLIGSRDFYGKMLQVIKSMDLEPTQYNEEPRMVW